MCKKCNKTTSYKKSARIHKRPPRLFFICSNCGGEVQGTINAAGEVVEFGARRKVPDDYVLSEPVSLRLSKPEKAKWKRSRATSRDIFLKGLEALP